MSQKTLSNVKKDRGFRLPDLIIYGVIALAVAVIFISVCATRDTRPLTGVRVYIGETAVFEYDFEKDKYSVKEGEKIEVTENGDKIEVKVPAGGGYNLIEIDKKGSVRVKDADCRSGDCTYMPAIRDNGGIIYCSPHRLKILPFGYDKDDGYVLM